MLGIGVRPSTGVTVLLPYMELGRLRMGFDGVGESGTLYGGTEDNSELVDEPVVFIGTLSMVLDR